MCNPSSSTLVHSCCYVLMALFLTSTYAYVINSDDLRTSVSDQQAGLILPSYIDRYIRTTKFPRIGRSPSDLDEISDYESNLNVDENDDNELRSLEQRSVLFPRIGKRAFHNIIWGNSYTNPHRTLDSQGRYHINGYDYHIHPTAYIHGKSNLSS